MLLRGANRSSGWDSHPREPARPHARPLGVLAVLCLLLWICSTMGQLSQWGILLEFAAVGAPALLCLMCALAALSLVRETPLFIWTPAFWVIVTIGLYFGFGPLAYCIGGHRVISQLEAQWPVSQMDLIGTNRLNLLGAGLLFYAAYFVISRSAINKTTLGGIAAFDLHQTKAAMWVFLMIGLPVEYLLALPHEFGQLGFELPGSVYQLTFLVQAAILLLAYLAAKKRGKWRILLVVLLISELGVNILRFNKTVVLFTILMAGGGWYLAKRQVRVLVKFSIIAVSCFIVLVPLVQWGRNELIQEEGSFYRASLDQRLAVTVKGFGSGFGTNGLRRDQAVFQGLARLCYTPAEAFAMQAYGRGQIGHSYNDALYTLIPRLIWPDKPIITSVGQEVTLLMQGFNTSGTGMGVFAEAYWNGGWPYVVIVSLGLGILLGLLSRAALRVMACGNVFLLPCVIWGIFMGMRIDGMLVGDYIGQAVIYLAYYVFLGFIKEIVVSREARSILIRKKHLGGL